LQPANDIPQFMRPVIVNRFPIPGLESVFACGATISKMHSTDHRRGALY